MGKHVGTSTGGVEASPRYRRKQAARRRAEEAAWAEQAGPVILRVGDRVVYVKSDRVKQDLAKVRELLLGGASDEEIAAAVGDAIHPTV